MLREPRARRSELATPASNERMGEKAARSGADLVFLDLEDACAPLAKEGARATRRVRPHRAGLGPDGASRPRQRLGDAVVSRRHHRGGLRRPRRARHHHRAEGPFGARRLVGRRVAHPARDEAAHGAPHRTRGAHRGVRGSGQRGRDRQGQRPARGDHLRRRRPVGVTAGAGRRQLRPGHGVSRATSGTSPASRS